MRWIGALAVVLVAAALASPSLAAATSQGQSKRPWSCVRPAGTFTFSYRAFTRARWTGDRGVWSVTGGTGSFAGLTGGGHLVGTYFTTGLGATDVWTGVIRFA